MSCLSCVTTDYSRGDDVGSGRMRPIDDHDDDHDDHHLEGKVDYDEVEELYEDMGLSIEELCRKYYGGGGGGEEEKRRTGRKGLRRRRPMEHPPIA